MYDRMKKLILIIIALLMLSGCSNLDTIVEEAVQGLADEAAAQQTDAPQTEDVQPAAVPIPTRPLGDCSGLRLFEDGCGPAALIQYFDGDTAEFMIEGEPYKVRFLAIDTPEIHSPHVDKQPWSDEAKAYTQQVLGAADEIVLEMDDESDITDDYGRLLAWMWADGELLNAKLVAQGFAEVKYLYGDYKYTDTLLALEQDAKDAGLRIWSGEDSAGEPALQITHTLGELKALSVGTQVTVSGIITNIIGDGAYIEDGTGAVYVYLGDLGTGDLIVGYEVIAAGAIKDYKGLREVSVASAQNVVALSSGNTMEPRSASLAEVGEELESAFVRIDDVTVTYVGSDNGNGYNVGIQQGDAQGVLRVDGCISASVAPSFFEVGDIIDVVGNVSQYEDTYQIMIASKCRVIK